MTNNVLYYDPKQNGLPPKISAFISINDPVVTFDRVMGGLQIEKYLVPKENNLGRPGYNPVNMLKTVLFGFMVAGYMSLRELEERCKTDIRFIYLMENETPTYRTFGYFLNNVVKGNISDIFHAVVTRIRELENIDMQHIYIDGTKLEANANKYTWVWKKATEKFRYKLFAKITALFEEMNTFLMPYRITLDTKPEYSPEELEGILGLFSFVCKVDPSMFVHGVGHRKTPEQRFFEKLEAYRNKLEEYVVKIEICGPNRNSYSKTDHDATFMRMKEDYMGNDQLLPAYNIQLGIADEYIVAAEVMQYRSDMDCFVPLMEQFHEFYGFYPKYPVADAGYGSFNNYIYCEEHGMEKYMKFPMYNKETKDVKYHNDPFRAVNFPHDEEGNLICPNGRKLRFAYRRNVRGNRYGRQDEYYTCEDCTGCPYAPQCKKTPKNRAVKVNEELTSMHLEVIQNLQSIQGCLLRMNRSIQAEGTFGIVKEDRDYRRIVRKGLESVRFELFLVAIGHDLYKFHNKQKRSGKTH